MTIKKRGRPVGVKNKPKTTVIKRSNISDFDKTLKEWDRMESENNWELIAKKQESRIAAYISENEELAKICVMRWDEIQHLKYLVTYLERKNEDSSI
jgi:predicted HAD superfamily phosphohydrolase YqeG